MITNRDVLFNLLKDIRKYKTIVFTNGCFDILHYGHVRFLRRAKALGDLLIVGVNSNDSVHRIKGDGRPVVHERYRMKLLDSLEIADFIIPFSEDTPCETIALLTPDIHVKGKDYESKPIPERRIVESYGGKVVLFELDKDVSTTGIVNRSLL